MNKIQLSIVLPAHNEADNLPILIRDVTNYMMGLGWNYEIIVVNDGSTDRTKEILDTLQRTDSHIKAVHHPKNRGYGATLRSGFSLATKEWIFFMDSDRQFNIQEMSKLAEHVDKYDIVIGYRKDRQDHLIRRINAGIFNMAVNLLFGLWIRDIDCAFKLLRREIVNKANLESNGALINTELLVRAKKLGYRIKQIPITHYPRLSGESSGGNIKVILRAVKEILLFRITNRTISGPKHN
ncbi:MAG: hypothetical protein A3C61_03135 [Candidatus Yanofskybacteria bacterium RIFCSPHIGHO2_02_FULL_39_10]|uniref:Glycosyltransferase 2-like domain-containing protein n=1 Tax=Candidatus Yanofskybacteria bacterium RIFCSPHIGHO2_02_FULL_39_10 TaxID=1802674 RepID=A0A1F8FAI0_9BACT|nr:MAG: hypothetical protein A3C61_03135 [Candidatus Yanofskybacteria bacterium RIFCSPHIGHO2_02_FULL_39_10]